jgi:ABC-2 type transport system permease protein
MSSLVIGTIGLAMNMDIVNGVMAGATILGTEIRVPQMSVSQFIETIQTGLAMLIAVVGLFLALMATSTLFPTMLQKGSIDLLLCRPIPRWRIITARFLGGSAIMAFNAAYLIVGVWFVLGLKSRIWSQGFPLSAVLLIFAFIVLFSVMMLASVMTENGPVGLLIAFMLIVASPILASHRQITPAFSQELYRQLFRSVYWVLPKTAEIIGAARGLIRNQPLEIGWVVGTSAGFALVCYIITMVYFTRKDY